MMLHCWLCLSTLPCLTLLSITISHSACSKHLSLLDLVIIFFPLIVPIALIFHVLLIPFLSYIWHEAKINKAHLSRLNFNHELQTQYTLRIAAHTHLGRHSHGTRGFLHKCKFICIADASPGVSELEC